MIKSNKRTAYNLLGTGAESPNSLEQNGVVLDGKTLKKYPRERRNATFGTYPPFKQEICTCKASPP